MVGEMNGNHIRYLHAIEKDGIDLKDRGIYLADEDNETTRLEEELWK